MQSPYQLLGEAKIRELAAAFYDVMHELPEAAPIRHMHHQNLDEIKQKLGDYLLGWMGGPPVYQQKHGTVCLTEPHASYAIGPEERDQWLLCFDKALARIGVSEEIQAMLRGPVARLAQAVQNRDAPLIATQDPNVIASG